jgi:2-polyprenyl-3-methyl-5-hydroxy-6-metoxy-1,4-benzoquinol methylase
VDEVIDFMNDFRTRLYDRYVSTFKGDSSLVGDALDSHWQWCDRRLLPLFAGLPGSARILELGCGPGYLLEYLERRGFTDVAGVDISAEQVAIAQKKQLRATVADVFATLEAAEGTLDAVVGIDLLEHFSKDEGIRLCDSIRRSLRPGGRVVFRTPNGSALLAGPIVYGDLTHMAIYNESSLRQLLALTGFGNLSFYETGPIPKNLRGVVRCGIWNAARAVANLVRMAESGGGQGIWTQNVLCLAFRPSEKAT